MVSRAPSPRRRFARPARSPAPVPGHPLHAPWTRRPREGRAARWPARACLRRRPRSRRAARPHKPRGRRARRAPPTARWVKKASRQLNSLHSGGTRAQAPGPFAFTEAQISAPFDHAPWRNMNLVVKAQPGLLHKTWLSGARTQSVGGFHALRHGRQRHPLRHRLLPRRGAGAWRRLHPAVRRAFGGQGQRGLHSPLLHLMRKNSRRLGRSCLQLTFL